MILADHIQTLSLKRIELKNEREREREREREWFLLIY